MSWRDGLRRVELDDGRILIAASFRGVPFFVESNERGGGRRVVVNEIPFLDEPTVDDFGRRARVYRMDGYVIGDDYLAQRDALASALEDEAGPGELIHPYYGTMPAICSGFGISETRDLGRMARFSIEFTWVPPSLAPNVVIDYAAAGDAAAEEATSLTAAEFEGAYDTDGMPAFSIESAASGLELAGEAMSVALSPVVQLTQDAALLRVNLLSMTSNAASLATSPASVTELLGKVISDLADTAAESPGRLAGALYDAYGFENIDFAPDTTPVRQQELANQSAMDRVIRTHLAVEIARLTVRTEYETIEEALAARDRAAGILDEQAEEAGDDTYSALMALRAIVVSSVPGTSVLARLDTLELPEAATSLVLSYRLYGDVSEADAIVARNSVPHPGFVPGGVSLKVLSNV